MQYLRNSVFLGLFLGTCGAGCGPTHTETDIGLPNGTKYKIRFPAGNNVVSSSQAGPDQRYVFVWSSGPLKMEVENFNLKVNGRDYGILKTGDAVVIDGRQEVKVTVNGTERMPLAQREPAQGPPVPKP